MQKIIELSFLLIFFSIFPSITFQIEPKIEINFLPTDVFHLYRPLDVVQRVTFARKTGLLIYLQAEHERYTIWIARYIMSLVQFQLFSAWTLLVIFTFGFGQPLEFTWHISLSLVLGGWQFYVCLRRWIFNAVLLSARRKNSPCSLAALLTLRKKDEITRQCSGAAKPDVGRCKKSLRAKCLLFWTYWDEPHRRARFCHSKENAIFET